MLSILSKTKIIILNTFILSSANAFNLDQFNILLFGKELSDSSCTLDCFEELICYLQRLWISRGLDFVAWSTGKKKGGLCNYQLHILYILTIILYYFKLLYLIVIDN